MMNVGNPERAFDFSQLPHQGIGLARLEFIIARQIGVHPKALIEYDRQPAEVKAQIDQLKAGYASPVGFYVERLVEGIATLSAAFAPHTVIVRLSDFKSNEYANLIGGSQYEPHEENPMIGFRGASRYVDPSFADCFALECQAVRKVRNEMGLTNCWVMIPFVRTLEEGRKVIEELERNGLKRGENDLKVIMMCEVPSNALLADEFLDMFDGFSIGSNDLTQLTLGLDRDSSIVAHLFDERNPAVKKLLSMAISAARARGKYIGICGQGPSDHPDLADWLMEQGIESLSRCRRRSTCPAQPAHEQPVVGQLIDRLADVCERGVAACLAEAVQQSRRPASRQFLEGAYIQIPIVEIFFEARHQSDQEAAVLADRVSADRRLVWPDPVRQELDRPCLGICQRDVAGHDPIPQARRAMRAPVPVVHGFQALEWMVNGQLGTFGKDVQVLVGDQGGDFDDRIAVRIQPGHFKIDPDEAIIVRRGNWAHAWLAGLLSSHHTSGVPRHIYQPGQNRDGHA
jgi:hypothetical protein